VRVSLFDYDLPPELIAQYALEERSASRMLVLERASGSIGHRQFTDLPQYLAAGDCLVINDTRVIPARLLGHRATGGEAELLLLRSVSDGHWEALARPARRLRVGETISFGGKISATVVAERPAGVRVVRLECAGDLMTALDRVGQTPLPPYIRRDQKPRGESSAAQMAQERQDRKRYQTVYARVRGAVAAPTAGLHFDEDMLQRFSDQGVGIARITLHVGLGTFRPVQTETVEDHRMDAESYEVSSEAARTINNYRAAGGRVAAVGTTVVRTLETVADESGRVRAGRGESELFIYPGHKFRAVDLLLTNFHLPRSTLLMLVSAFAGREKVLQAYQEAVERRYRFYSYGDCMLIL